jgi:hypothetical protein
VSLLREATMRPDGLRQSRRTDLNLCLCRPD